MFARTDSSAKPWRSSGRQRRLVFALVGTLVALSYALFIAGGEAQAKGERQAPDRNPANKVAGDADRSTREAAGGTAGHAGDKGAGREATRENGAAGVHKPRADRPAPVDTGPARETAKQAPNSVTNKADRAVSTVSDKANPVVDTVSGKAAPVAEHKGPLGEAAGPASSAVEPVVERAASTIEPVSREVTGDVRPVLDEATSTATPVLKDATAPVRPVLDEKIPAAGSILEGANLPGEPALEEALPVVEPILDKDIPAVPEPTGGAVEPVPSPLPGAAWPAETAGPKPEKIAPPSVTPVTGETPTPAGPVSGEAVPPVEPAFEPATHPVSGTLTGPVTPVVGAAFEVPVAATGLAERAVGRSDGASLLPGLAGVAPGSSPTNAIGMGTVQPVPWPVQSAPNDPTSSTRSPAVEASGSTVGLSATHSGLFDRSFFPDGEHRAGLPGFADAEDTENRAPGSFPWEFPYGVAPAASSLGGSGTHLGLDLLAILALSLILWRFGGRSWCSRDGPVLGFSPQLVVERPG